MKSPAANTRLFFGLGSCLLLAPLLGNCSDKGTSVKSLAVGGGVSAAGAAGDVGPSAVFVCGTPAPRSECDPLTAAPCDVRGGQTCDYDFESGSFICFDGPNLSGAGQLCNETNFCGASTTCQSEIHVCQHYCCVDADCDVGVCTPAVFADGNAVVGGCADEFRTPSASDGGAGGSAGASNELGESPAGSSGTGGEGG